VQLVAINDLHGQLPDNDAVHDGTAIGGAATLAAYAARERAKHPTGTVVVGVGDSFGASPPESALLRHESTLDALAAMGMQVAAVGNHELDRGIDELVRLVLGDRRAALRRRKNGRFRHTALSDPAAVRTGPWKGSAFPWLSANIIDRSSGRPVFPPWAIMEINGVKVGFVGAVTKDALGLVPPASVRSIQLEDPVTAINRHVPELRKRGVRTIVAVVHEGSWVNADGKTMRGPGMQIARDLDPEIDVVMNAHSHAQYATRVAGKIVTQAGSYAEGLSVVRLQVDPRSGDVVSGNSEVIVNDERGVAPEPKVHAIAQRARKLVGPRVREVVSELPGTVSRKASRTGESPLGALVAQAQRAHARADIGLFNNGGLRRDLASGPITWGSIFAAQPYGNRLLRMELTGREVRAVLEQQFQDGRTVMLQLSGIRAMYDPRRNQGKRVVRVQMEDGTPLVDNRTYTVAVNDYLGGGGDGLTVLRRGRQRTDLGVDLAALVEWLRAGKPVPLEPPGNVQLVAGARLPGHID
jgi:5'-nucleotidase